MIKCKAKGDRAFSYFGPSVWNSLPLHFRNDTTVTTLKKKKCQTYLFNQQESDWLIKYLPNLPCVCVYVYMHVCVWMRGRERGSYSVSKLVSYLWL